MHLLEVFHESGSASTTPILSRHFRAVSHNCSELHYSAQLSHLCGISKIQWNYWKTGDIKGDVSEVMFRIFQKCCNLCLDTFVLPKRSRMHLLRAMCTLSYIFNLGVVPRGYLYIKNKLPRHNMRKSINIFNLQLGKQRRIKEFGDRNTHSIAKEFKRDHSGIFALAIDDIF